MMRVRCGSRDSCPGALPAGRGPSDVAESLVMTLSSGGTVPRDLLLCAPLGDVRVA